MDYNNFLRKGVNMSYNGYTNWATWNVALWFGNDEGLYHTLQEPFICPVPFKTEQETEAFVKELMPDGMPDFDANTENYKDVDWAEVQTALNELAGFELCSECDDWEDADEFVKGVCLICQPEEKEAAAYLAYTGL